MNAPSLFIQTEVDSVLTDVQVKEMWTRRIYKLKRLANSTEI
jgi:hypothetical protein